MNNKTLNVSTQTSKSFDITPFGRFKNLCIRIYKSSSYELVIDGINLIERYLININYGFSMVASLSARVRATTEIVLANFTNTFIGKENLRIPLLLNNNIDFSFYPRELLNFVYSIPLTFALSANLKEGLFSSTTIDYSFSLSFTPEIREYLLLSDHDSKTLGDMDGNTLAELDYQIV